MIKVLTRCRICQNETLTPIIDLGEQMLTGVFPRARDQQVTTGPLRLVKCTGEGDVCGLVQLAHSYDLGEMYGDNYGYRSGLNPSMVRHLEEKVARIRGLIEIGRDDIIVDIGSNDATTLKAYGPIARRVGIDPTGTKFSEFYPEDVALIADFFSADAFRDRFPDSRAKVVTSFSMFYDLEAPMAFMQQVHDILADDGIWVFEQSYLPAMLATNSYDTVCHEHLEFYALQQIQWMAARVGFRIVDVAFNDVNGGSFSVTVEKAAAGSGIAPDVQAILDREIADGVPDLATYEAFARRVEDSRDQLLDFLARARDDGRRVAALGASTKGNVLLQYCGLTTTDIEAVGEVNPDKFGSFTPGTFLPIVPEDALLDPDGPEILLVLPWHFRRYFEGNPKFAGKTLVFPLPVIEEV